MTIASTSFNADWYQIVEVAGQAIVAGPVPLSGAAAVDDFIAETTRDWPGGGERELQFSANQNGPWSVVATLA